MYKEFGVETLPPETIRESPVLPPKPLENNDKLVMPLQKEEKPVMRPFFGSKASMTQL